MKDFDMSAAALYDGRWRSTDGPELMAEYGLTQDEVDEITVGLYEIENDL